MHHIYLGGRKYLCRNDPLHIPLHSSALVPQHVPHGVHGGEHPLPGHGHVLGHGPEQHCLSPPGHVGLFVLQSSFQYQIYLLVDGLRLDFRQFHVH